MKNQITRLKDSDYKVDAFLDNQEAKLCEHKKLEDKIGLFKIKIPKKDAEIERQYNKGE